MAAKQRDQRLLQLTSTELAGLPKETKVYEGVGKMYVPSYITMPSSHLPMHFRIIPIPDCRGEVGLEEGKKGQEGKKGG